MSTESPTIGLSQREKFTIGVLCCINLFNFIDRTCISSVLLDIQRYFKVEDDLAGLIQTGYVIGYTAASPLFGYLGDRYSRKLIVMSTLIIWIVMGFLNTLVSNFVLFVLTRAMVGIGESGFTVLAPAILSDIIPQGSRTVIFAIFYYSLPVGAGLGMAISATINRITEGQWWWGLMTTPLLNIFCLVLIMFGVDPKTGEKDAAALGGNPAQPTTYKEDLRYLLTNKSFLFITFGYTCICFMNAALTFWGAKTISYGVLLVEGEHGTDDGTLITILGFTLIGTGILGVTIGSGLSKWLRPKYPFVDPIIVGAGLFLAFPFYNISLFYTAINLTITIVFAALCQVVINFNWAVVMDMLMYVVIPTRRASAKGLETFISHILGNSVSTTIVGVISEAIQDRNDFTSWHYQKTDNTTLPYGKIAQNFYGLQFALFSITIVFIIGGVIFMLGAFYIAEDKERATADTVEK